MSSEAAVVFLIDVDNTLLDNDAVQQDMRTHLVQQFGAASAAQYWELFEQLRSELGYSDYLGALQRFRTLASCDMRLLRMSSFLLDYPFAERLYPGALTALAHLQTLGPCALLTDGDVVFQPHKVERSGLWDASAGQVLIYVHKELKLDEVARRYPAEHYVFIDDKPRLVDAIKRHWGDRVTTVLPRQGQYALAPVDPSHLAPDISIGAISELINFDLQRLRQSARAVAT